jgi:O-succinylbenzoate synthase
MSLLAGDVTANPLAETGGFLPVRAGVVDEAALGRFEVDPASWRARLLAAAEYLPALAESELP